ncbi:hypothetical protein [Microvirga splendida]|uniref:Uncharacterized protein n=1 Tax=Microvirga splendida TaxID=2795727 RepID=A0ABS0XYC4_9HYPH|nr:hypothetical protein [Microvirga splendida]MBJ6124740.1 hypothetical protein [Microvirga splendida]
MKWLAAFVSCVMLSAPVIAREITPAERREIPFDASLPACADPSVFHDISTKFAHKEYKFWNSTRTIVAFERVQQVAWRPWGLDYIPRRFCTGTVLMSDGERHRINYSIREDLGFLGIGWDTLACVDGFDNNHAYAPHCKQAAP